MSRNFLENSQMEESVFLKLYEPLRNEIESIEWIKATKIQELAIPKILEGEHVLLIVPTGTGKTEANLSYFLKAASGFLEKSISQKNG